MAAQEKPKKIIRELAPDEPFPEREKGLDVRMKIDADFQTALKAVFGPKKKRVVQPDDPSPKRNSEKEQG